MSDRNRTLILCGLLLTVPFLVFFPTLEAGFLNWDDDVNVFNNPKVQGLTGENLAWMFTDFKHAIRYKPLSWLSWAIVHEFSGLNPFGYHLANVLVHCANGLFLFLLIRKLIELGIHSSSPGNSNLDWLAAGGALLWAVHPMRVEPVSWVTGLPYGVAFFFALAATLLYLHAIKADDKRTSTICYTISIVTFVLASITYPIVLGFPAALFAIEFFPLKQFTSDGRINLLSPEAKAAYRRLLPFVLVSVALVGWTVYGRYRFTDYWIKPATMEDFGIGARIMQAAYVWAYYVWKPLWPADLAPVYTELIWNHPLDTAFVISLLMIISITGVLVWRWKQCPAALAIWIAHLGILVPMLGLTERPHYAHDRYGIINGALWPIAIVASAIYCRSRARLRNGIFAFGMLGILICSINSRNLTQNWRDNIAFFSHMEKKLGANEYRNLALMNLGEAYLAEQQFQDAIPRFEEAANREVLWIFPFDFQRLAVNHGAALLGLSRWGEAEVQFRKAIAINPGNVAARNNLAIVLLRQNRPREAVIELQSALQLDPTRADTLLNLGSILTDANRPQDALPFLTQALANTSEPAPIHAKLAEAYRQLGDNPRAAEHAAQAQ